MKFYYSFLRKLWRHNFLGFVLCVFVGLFSNIFQLLSFFLPLKALMVASMPTGFSVFNLSGKQLSLCLAVLAVFCFLGHWLLFRFYSMLTDNVSRKLISRVSKFSHMHSREERASDLYRKAVGSFVSLLFCGCLLLVGSYFLPVYVLAFIVTVFFVCVAFALWGFIRSGDFLFSFAGNDRAKSVSNFIFFLYFFITLYLVSESRGVFFSAASLLGVRMLLSTALSAIRDVLSVADNIPIVRTLFYTATSNFSPAEESSIWSDMRAGVISGLFSEFSFSNSLFYQTGYKNCLMMVCASGANRYLVKYAKLASMGSLIRERELFSESWSRALPVLPLYEFRESDRFCSIIFEGNPARVERDKELDAIKDISLACWCAAPPEDFLQKYRRTYSVDVGNKYKSYLKRLELVVSDRYWESYDFFKNNYISFIDFMDSSPVSVMNSELYLSNCFLDGTGRTVALNWSKWSVLPLGGGVPPSIIDSLSETDIERVKLARVDCGNLTIERLRLASALVKFDEHMKYDSFEHAFELISRIKQLFENAKDQFYIKS